MRKPAETLDDPFAADSRNATVDVAAEGDQATAGLKRRGWRRLAQVNLLMVLVALALVSGYFAMRRNLLVPYLEQREAMDELAIRGAQFASVPARPRWVQTLFQISDDDFQNVEMIKLEGSEGLRDETLVLLHKFPHLTRLYLASTQVTDEGMKHLRYCTKLRRISLWDTHVGDAGIAELETLQDLRIIDLHRTWTTDESLKTLGKLPALEALILDDATTERGISHLSGLSNLRRLDLRRTGLRAECLEHLKNCPIETLEIPRQFVDRENADCYRFVPRLRSLILTLPGATDEDLEWLGAMKNLRLLQLFELQAEGDFARHIARMPQLESLEVHSDRLRTETLSQALSAPRLRDVGIAASVTEEDLRSLPDRRLSLRLSTPWLPHGLRELDSRSLRTQPRIEVSGGNNPLDPGFGQGAAGSYVSGMPFYATRENLAPLLRQANLRELTLINWDFAPGALASLSRLERLESVALVNCRFVSAELVALAGLPELKRFHVGDAPVGDEELAAFARAEKLESLEVHLTDARPETVLSLVKRESLAHLMIYATTLDDAFLDAADAELAPRVRRQAERIVQEKVGLPTGRRIAFSSPGFTSSRARTFEDKYLVVVGLANVPGVDPPKDYQGYWPKEPSGYYGRVIAPDAPGMELSPLAFPSVERREAGLPAALHQFAYAHALSPATRFDVLEGTNFGGVVRRRPWHDRVRVPELGDDPLSGQVGHLPLDRIDAESASLYLRRTPTALSISHGALPKEALEDLARSPAEALYLQEGVVYDEVALRAIARMPKLREITFDRIRKPTLKELAILFESKTLQRILLEHAGEPIYFRDVAASRRGASPKLVGKVVYDFKDAVAEEPLNLILANFRESDIPRLLEKYQFVSQTAFRDDYPNQLRLSFRLEIEQMRQQETENAGALGRTPERATGTLSQ